MIVRVERSSDHEGMEVFCHSCFEKRPNRLLTVEAKIDQAQPGAEAVALMHEKHFPKHLISIALIRLAKE